MTPPALRLAALATSLLAATVADAATIVRGPYLQQPTPAGMTLRWRTDVPTDSRVRYGAAPGSLGLTVDDAAVTTEHVVTVSALAPDTVYFYAIGSTSADLEGDDADHFFRTTPTPGAVRPLRIWVTGDGGYANADGMAVRDAYAAYNGAAPTDLWLLLGDNAYPTGNDANYQAALFDLHHDMLRSVPTLSTFGNHEAMAGNSALQTGPYFTMFTFPTAGEAGGVPSGSEAYFSYDYGNVHFVVLDSEHNSKASTSPMMLWLEADLQATTADWIIALWHRPPYSKGLLHDSDLEFEEITMRTNVVPMLEDYGVDLVLCGHSHSYERSYLLDGHYGLSDTFELPVHARDAGDGDPSGNGPYRKPSLGQSPRNGAVYVVAGSSSDVRTTTLNHPALPVGLLELGSLVLDVDGQTLTGTFVNAATQAADRFRIVKGPSCPSAPRGGCASAPKGRIALRNDPVDTKDKAQWKWQNGTLDSTQIGMPSGQSDVAVCLYDQSGSLFGDALGHGAPAWKAKGGGVQYVEKSGAHAGITSVKGTSGTGKGQIQVKGAGASLALPAGAPAFPLTAQLINLQSGACWESVFPTAKVNDGVKLSAKLP
ncbi:MAG: metallophosphoesterase family protein [Deltaproteobacteria bacterium]|nr:metallophosphoesterase family protein [Deltaproteobacteria bacterium]